MRDLLLERARLSPDALALSGAFGALSWSALAQRAVTAAWSLRARGVRSGDLVALLLENGLDLAVLVHAVPLAGGVLLPLHARATAPELAFLLADARPSLLVHGDGPLSEVARDAAALAGVPCAPSEEVVAAGLDARIDAPPCSWREPASVAAVLYTSGTTGRPKGAELTSAALVASATASILHLGALRQDCWLACLPLYHVGGLSILWRAALQGASVVLHERFDAERASRALDEDGVTLASFVPTMLSRVLEARGDRPAPAALRALLLGGGAAPRVLLERAAAARFRVLTTYGLTEAASQVTTAPLGDPDVAPRAPVGSGVPLLGTEVQIVAEGGAPRAPGERGEIVVRGPTLLRGYLGRPDDTRRALAGGRLHTGDVGYLDEAGRLHVDGRRADLVVSGGENVYPAEVEAVLLEHPHVSDVGVGGLPDAEWGARVGAWIVLRDGVRASAGELERFCRTRLAPFKVPREWRFVRALPRNATGKLVRHALPDGAPPADGARLP
jgi:O-succinylbenzoic acid--CoA ligase